MDTFEVSSFQPHGLPAAFQSRDILLAVQQKEKKNDLRSLTSTGAPLIYALPDFEAIHQLCVWFPLCKNELPRHPNRHVVHFSVPCVKVKPNGEGQNGKKEKEVVSLRGALWGS